MARSPFSASSTLPVLARVPALPADDREPVDDADALLREGMFLASRHLDRAAEQNGDRDRLAVTRRSYEIRAGRRPVPHGIFAGVALARYADPGEAPALRLGAGHRVRTNPSAAWLAALHDQLLTDPAVLSALTLSANNLVTRRGRRLVHERSASNGAVPYRVSVRATAATELIMSVCAAGVSMVQIRARIAERWTVPEHVLSATVADLVREGFLIADVLPADLTADPLGHLLGRLAEHHQLRGTLVMLREVLAGADRLQPGDPVRRAALRDARDLADRVCLVERPLTADLAADARLVLPTSLGVEAAVAAGVLWRVRPGDAPPLARCHDRFLERYGVHRFVPVLEATDPASASASWMRTRSARRSTEAR